MTRREQIQWPYGFTGSPRRVGTIPVPSPTNHTLQNFVAGLNDAGEAERREFFTWLRQMLDYYGIDSATAIERGIDPEPTEENANQQGGEPLCHEVVETTTTGPIR